VKLVEVCEFKYGDSLREDQRRGGDFPVYGSNGLIGWHDRAITKGPTIIIGRKGSLGEVHYSEKPCWPIDTTYYIDEFKKPTDISWFYYLLRELELTKLNKSAAVPGLNRNDAYEIEISFPPLPEQKRIAAILEKADRLRRLRRYARKLSDSFLQSVFLEMFGDPVRNPKGWKTVRIGDVVSVSQYGTSQRSNNEMIGYPIIGMGNITENGRLDLRSIAYVDLSLGEFHKLRLEKGDVIFNRTNSTELVGKTALWNLNMDAVIASYLVKLRLKEDIMPIYFVGLVNTPSYKQLFQLRCRKAVGQSNISPTLLKEFNIPLPPLSEQKKYESVAVLFDDYNKYIREAERQSEKLFQSLLHRAFRGEL